MGTSNSLAFNPATGYPSIAYSDSTNDAVKIATSTGSTWQIQTIEQGRNVASSISLAFGPDDRPSVVYGNTDLKFAHWNGSGWSSQIIDRGLNGTKPSIVYDATGAPAVAYSARSTVKGKAKEAIKFARWNGSAWAIDTIDYHDTWTYLSVVFDANGNPVIAYDLTVNVDRTTSYGVITAARKVGGVWQKEVVHSPKPLLHPQGCCP